MPLHNDFNWQRHLIPHAKQILANYLIGEAPDVEDMHRNTDLIVLTMNPVRVACRFRRNHYLTGPRGSQYADEFTIRLTRPSGAMTELAKVLSGWGDFIFYGFARPDGEDGFAAWLIGSLHEFRNWHAHALFNLPAGRLPGSSIPNADGSSEFMVYRVDDLPDGFVVARRRWDPPATHEQPDLAEVPF